MERNNQHCLLTNQDVSVELMVEDFNACTDTFPEWEALGYVGYAKHVDRGATRANVPTEARQHFTLASIVVYIAPVFYVPDVRTMTYLEKFECIDPFVITIGV